MRLHWPGAGRSHRWREEGRRTAKQCCRRSLAVRLDPSVPLRDLSCPDHLPSAPSPLPLPCPCPSRLLQPQVPEVLLHPSRGWQFHCLRLCSSCRWLSWPPCRWRSSSMTCPTSRTQQHRHEKLDRPLFELVDDRGEVSILCSWLETGLRVSAFFVSAATADRATHGLLQQLPLEQAQREPLGMLGNRRLRAVESAWVAREGAVMASHLHRLCPDADPA